MIPAINPAVENLPNPVDKKVSVNAMSNHLNNKSKINMILENSTSPTIHVSTANIKMPKLDKKSTKLKLKKYHPKNYKIKSAKLIKYKNDKNEPFY
mgnify:CR=1 FL=1